LIQLPPIGLAEVVLAEEDSHGRTGLGEFELSDARLFNDHGAPLFERRTGAPVAGEEIGHPAVPQAEDLGGFGHCALDGAELSQLGQGDVVMAQNRRRSPSQSAWSGRVWS
jgi:hypothetical protein